MKTNFTKSPCAFAHPLLVSPIIFQSRKVGLWLLTLFALSIHLVSQGAEKPSDRSPYVFKAKSKGDPLATEWTKSSWLPNVAGTLSFSGTSSIEFPSGIIKDGDAGSTNIPEINYQIYAADLNGTFKNTSWYFLLANEIAPIAGIASDFSNGGAIVVIKSEGNVPFSFEGIKVNNYEQFHSSIRFEGYLNGESTGNVILNLTNIYPYTSTFTTTQLLPSIFEHVDEVRIVNSSTYLPQYKEGIFLLFNDIVFGDGADPNEPPSLDLNGAQQGVDHTTTFTSGSSGIRIASTDAVLSDDGQLASLKLVLSETPDGSDEAIAYDASLNSNTTLASLGLTSSYNASTGTYLISGSATSFQYQSVLRALIYTNSSDAPTTTARSIILTLTDAGGETVSVTSTINVESVVDDLAPFVSISSNRSTLSIGKTATITFTLSESSANFTEDDITVTGGTLDAFDGSGLIYTAVFTPTEDYVGTATIDVAAGTFTDAAGNDNTAASTLDIAVDTSLPMATIVVEKSELRIGETSLVTITFNRAVTGFTLDDLAYHHGTLTPITTTNGGVTWYTTFTPEADTDEPENEIVLDLTGIADANGYTGIGTATSNAFSIRTVPLTFLVTTLSDTGDDASPGASLTEDQSDGNGLSLREALHWARNKDIINFNQGGTIILNGTQLTINSTVQINGDLNNDAVADVTISGNQASRVMRVSSNVKGVELNGLTITNGFANGGGAGIYLESGAEVTLRHTNLTNNTEMSNGGGAVYGSGVTLNVIGGTISGNTSVAFGGALRIVSGNGTFLNIINTTITGNSTTGAAQHGGAIQFGGETLTMINTTVSGNAALGSNSLGGALRVTSGKSYIYNSTIVGNAAAGGAGGVHANGTDYFANTVIAGNTSGADARPATGGSPIAIGSNADDVGSVIESAFNNYFGTTAMISAENNINNLNNQGTLALNLQNLAYHHGSHNLTHKPLAGSALNNAGSNDDLPADTFDLNNNNNTTEPLPFDANGKIRVSQIVDIGAVEGNMPPVLANLNGGNIHTEGSDAVIIDGDVTVSDADLDLLNGGLGNYSGAKLVIVRQDGADTTDHFGFQDNNGITLVDDQLVVNEKSIGSFDRSVLGELSITFTDANGVIPSRSLVNQILQQITYSTLSNDPSRTVDLDWTFYDEFQATAMGSPRVTIQVKNDPPVLTATGASLTFTTGDPAVTLFQSTQVQTIESGQTLLNLQLIVSQVQDGGDEILQIDGSEVALTEGSAVTTATTQLQVEVAVEGTTATVTLSHATGVSPTVLEGIIDGIAYRNNKIRPHAEDRVITLTSIQDNGGTENQGVDTQNLSISSTVTMVVLNHAPVISGTPATTVNQDEAYSFLPTFENLDEDELIFSIENKPEWASFNTATGALSGTPGNEHVGTTEDILIWVSDGLEADSLVRFSLTVVNVNDDPVLSGQPETQVNKGSAYHFLPEASDIDAGDVLTFSIVNKPAWATFNTETGELSGTPENEDVGVTEGIVISVSDGTATVSLDPFDLEVINVNRPPTISMAGAPNEINQGEFYEFFPTFNDPDGDALIFDGVNIPGFLTVDSLTGRVYGTPGQEDIGLTVFEFFVRASDDNGIDWQWSEDSFHIFVHDVNDAPIIEGTPATTINQDEYYVFYPNAYDVDTNATLQFSIVNKPAWAHFDETSGMLYGQPGNDDVGTYSYILITVSDGTLQASLPAFTIEVRNVNDAPTIGGTPLTTIHQDATYTFTPLASDIDANDVLTFSITNKPSWASFNPATGTLSGTPGQADVGETADIEISVSDGTTSVYLAPFTLSVTTHLVTGVTLSDTLFYYDGTEKMLTIKGALPAGTSVTYTGNKRTALGSQLVTATISGLGYTTLELTAELTILSNEITGVTLDHNRFTYDGTPKSLSITGTLPEGTSVTYYNNSHIDVGHYVVRAVVSGAHYDPLELEAALLIVEAPISGLYLEQEVFVYDGAEKSLNLAGTLPEGATVSFTGNARTDVGVQKVTARIEGPNHQPIELTAELRILPATITGITLNNATYTYDGTEKYLSIEGQLPEGVTVSYVGNGRKVVGRQEVKATVTGPNYHPLVLTAQLEVVGANSGRTFTFPAISTLVYGGPDVALRAMAGADEQVVYTSSNPSVVTIVGGMLRIVGAGTAYITASVDVHPVFGPAQQLVQTVTVRKANQSITLSAPREIQRQVGTLVLSVQSSSGLPVTLSVDEPAVASLQGTTLHLHRAGKVRVTAIQQGDANHEAAAPVSVEINVLETTSQTPIRVHIALSPNGDGINDFLFIEGLQGYSENRVEIFDQHGKVLWDATGYNNQQVAFRGVEKSGKRLSNGTYYYSVGVKVNGKWTYTRGYFVLRY